MTWYKVTRLDGGSFHAPPVTYVVGKRIRPKPFDGDRKLCGKGTLHASASAPEAMRYGKWPCRLFVVKGTPFVEDSDKAGFRQLRVVRELDVWRVFGPNGRHVEAVLERIAVCTPDEIGRLDAAWDAARDAAWGAAWGAARDAARGAAWDAAWDAALGAALGAVVADLIGQYGYTQEHYDLLAAPWREVVGMWNGTEWEKER